MEPDFLDKDLQRLEEDGSFDRKLPGEIVSLFRRRMQLIRSATDERDLRALKSLRLEKLKGRRQGQYSIRLNDQWRLIIQFEGKGPDKRVLILEIVDYH